MRKRGVIDTEKPKEKYCDSFGKRKVGHVIKELNGAFKKKFLSCGVEAGLDEVTFMHGWIMGYLHFNRDREIYQKTIESDFKIRRSTVTAILQLMEKKGYIKRDPVADDARLKRILLTEKGMETAEKTKEIIDRMENDLLEGIEPDQLDIFYEVSDKLLKNMKK
ncbi:MAG: MarR family transcriptional regulator [Lachnospiraceae bacterium]|nr:MarR family transcriptional regulator [Lachnospiraceae bacterium]MBQ1993251.1 MarR family transcriptional regulator [Lachnospiraceae bacterium]MBQ2405890.1 MarR family transcriptional regulator [Lachnospiraceae bacterium]